MFTPNKWSYVRLSVQALYLMTSLAPAERQLASMAADKPTATACCPIFLVTILSSRETGLVEVSASHKQLSRWNTRSRRKSTAFNLGLPVFALHHMGCHQLVRVAVNADDRCTEAQQAFL